MGTELHAMQAVHPCIAALLVKAIKHESKSTGPNSHPTSVAGLLEIGKVRVACVHCSSWHRFHFRTWPVMLQATIALASPVVEKALRCSSLLDPTTHYATPLPRLPHPSPELRIARDAAAAPGPVSGALVTACDTCRLGATTWRNATSYPHPALGAYPGRRGCCGLADRVRSERAVQRLARCFPSHA